MSDVELSAHEAWEDDLGFELEPEDITAWIADLVLHAMPRGTGTQETT